METQYEIYMYMPINLNEYILISYVTECSGNGMYNFNKRKIFYFMKKIKIIK